MSKNIYMSTRQVGHVVGTYWATGWTWMLTAGLLLATGTGCATCPSARDDPNRWALRTVPQVFDSDHPADARLIAAFFEAHGIRLSDAQVADIVDAPDARDGLDRNALRQAALRHGYRLLALRATPRYLKDQLAGNRTLLVWLSPDPSSERPAEAVIPLAWDQAQRRMELLDGRGQIRSMPEDEFFSRHEPRKHAALCLVKTKGVRRSDPPREQQMLLSDFWNPPGSAPQAQNGPAHDPPVYQSNDLQSIMTCGRALFRQRRYRDAIGVFEAGRHLAPDNPEVLTHLAHALLMGNGGVMTALRHANKAHRLAPHDPFVLETLGSINLQLGLPEEAVRYFELAWARALRQSAEVQVVIMDQLVRAWLAADRLDHARQVAEQRCRTFPDYPLPRDIRVQLPGLYGARRTAPVALQKQLAAAE